MRYEWDDAKARSNLTKHGVDFADAALALEDPLALTREDQSARGEPRFVTVAADPFGRTVLVVFTW